MDLICEPTGFLFQLADDERVNVLVIGAFVEPRIAGVCRECLERSHQLRHFVVRENADAPERTRERLRSANIGENQAFVEVQGPGEPFKRLRRPLLESATPEFHFADFSKARTLIGRPIQLINPSASFWSYSAPMVKLAMLSE